jgi:Flp pilus assembly protein protease CpaA
MQLSTLIGFFTAVVIIVLFSFIERKRVPKLGINDVFFLLYVVFCSYVYKPSHDILGWVGISLLCYCVLDDLKSKTIDIIIPILVTLIFFINTGNPYNLFISFLSFALILAFSSITRENIIGKGDAYLFLPLGVILGSGNILPGLFLSMVLGAVFMTVISLCSKEKEFEHPFGPYLVLGSVIVACHFYSMEITLIVTALSMICMPIVYFLTREKEK